MSRAATALVALTLAGCSMLPSPVAEIAPTPLVAGPGEAVRFPQSAAAEPGRAYPIEIGTHCGVGETPIDFDGAFWTPADDLPELVPGLDGPFAEGTIALTAPANAVFVSDGGVRIDLVRHAGPHVFVLCR